jgi:hypothetical protein
MKGLCEKNGNSGTEQGQPLQNLRHRQVYPKWKHGYSLTLKPQGEERLTRDITPHQHAKNARHGKFRAGQR